MIAKRLRESGKSEEVLERVKANLDTVIKNTAIASAAAGAAAAGAGTNGVHGAHGSASSATGTAPASKATMGDD